MRQRPAPDLVELQRYVDFSGYSNAAWKFKLKESEVRALLAPAPAPERVPRASVRALHARCEVALAALPAAPRPLPVKPQAPVTQQERTQVLAALTAAGRPLSKSLLLCRLRGWSLDRLELTLTELLAARHIYTPDTGRYGVTR